MYRKSGYFSENYKATKYVRSRAINETAIKNFRQELTEIDISSLWNAYLLTDPNIDYEIFEKKNYKKL